MEIKFLNDKAFNTAYTLLYGHNFTFTPYKSESVFKFFYPEMLEKAISMLTSRDIVESEDYTLQESRRMDALS